MKRDLDLVRLILIAIENSADDEPGSIRLPRHEVDPLHLAYHIRLLHEGRLIHAVENRGSAIVPHSLTWHGHEFVTAIRDDGIWQAIKAIEGGAGGNLPFAMLYELAIRELRRSIGLFDGEDCAPCERARPAASTAANYVQSIAVCFEQA